MMTHIDYICRAFNLALKARGRTSPNPLVGAVIVKNNRIIAEGWHRRRGEDHAEIAALKKAGRSARGARLYVTLEPCSHYGRTPPCVDKIIESGIKEVFIGIKDPNPLTNGKSITRLRRAGIKTKTGFIEEDIKAVNESFIKYITTKMPFVTAKCAQTLDGKIATATGHSKWITSPKSRDFAHRLRNHFDAIVVGIETVLKDDPSLNATGSFKEIKKVILDSSLRLPLTAKLFRKTKTGNVIVATTKKANKRKRDLLARRGVSIIICPSKKNRVDLRRLFKELAKREIASILIEGGAQVIGDALRQKLVDKFLIFLAPKIMGDQNALNAVAGFKLKNVNQAISLNNLTVQKIAEDVFIEAYVHRNR